MGTQHYPWQLQEPAAFGADFLWRQKVTARFGKRELSFRAVVQKQANVLTLIGLGPAGSKAFVLKQTGAEVDFRSLMPKKLPFPPRYILTDIQRAWLPLGGQVDDADGERALVVADEIAVEIRAQGRRTERRFTRKSGQPAGTITVRYQSSPASGKPGPVRLDNGWFGYSLIIETLEARSL
jgi:hypothetical protein